MVRLTDSVIDVQAVREAISRDEAGAVLIFEGVTRNHHDGRTVMRLEYEAYAGMAEAQMSAICAEISGRWPGARVAMVHRVGVVGVGEASVVIGVSAPHRDEAYAASRRHRHPEGLCTHLEEEIYADGSVWKPTRSSVMKRPADSPFRFG